MVVSKEIKSQLAKLLATEDLIVEHKKVDTAQFDVCTRVLTLPMWNKASNTVYDLLVGHEVGHALYTPDEDWSLRCKVPTQFVNVVEDARIEKLMKRKYPGLAKTFYNGYNELHREDFFEVNCEDITTFNLADRANLYFKVGNFIPLVFSSFEESVITLIKECETFDDTLKAAETLYLYCKEQEQRQEEHNDPKYQDTNSPSEMPDEGFDESELNEEERKEDPAQLDVPSFQKDSGENNEPEIKTMDSLDKTLKDLVDTDGHENVYVEIPTIKLDQIIISNEEIHELCDEHWNGGIKESDHYGPHLVTSIEDVDNQFLRFKKNAQKEVNYLVKEFECRKAADNYSRTNTSRTGVLDTKKLQTYRFNEDLFKRVSVIPDGKNHGLVFILDWSGSMQSVILDTIKQLYNLLWFCKKVNIPFEVYAFTNDFPHREKFFERQKEKRVENQIRIREFFSLMNLFTSKVNGKTLEHQMMSIFRLAYAFQEYCAYNIPIGMRLSGTPLNESLICLHEIIPKFKKDNNLQKVQCIVLTDGEATGLEYNRVVKRPWEDEPYMGMANVGCRCFLRDRKIGNTYSLSGPGGWSYMTDVLLKNLRDKFKDVNFIGIRILESRDAGYFIRDNVGHGGQEYHRLMKEWRKNKSFSIKTSGYHSYFGLSNNILMSDPELQVGVNPTKAQIKSAFANSLKNKKLNKKVLSEFISLVA